MQTEEDEEPIMVDGKSTALVFVGKVGKFWLTEKSHSAGFRLLR